MEWDISLALRTTAYPRSFYLYLKGSSHNSLVHLDYCAHFLDPIFPGGR